MHRHRPPSSRMLFVISPPPVSPPRLPVHPRSSRENNEGWREGRRKKKEEKERERERDRPLCDTRLPRIPERRLSPLPLNIHPLGKADKNKEKARSTIPSRPLPLWKYSLEARPRCPATRGSLFILEFILY